MITAGLCSTQALQEIAQEATMPFIVIQVDSRVVTEISPEGLDRLARVVTDADAVMAYADYHELDAGNSPVLHRLIDYQPGAVRDDFGFGPLVVVRTEAFRQATARLEQYSHAAWYALRLALSRMGSVVHIPEPLYSVHGSAASASQFDYVNPRNREVQIEMEQAFTLHLEAIGALVKSPFAPISHDGEFKVEASVVIPVYNRVATVADAVKSALSQKAEFDFNVIVVDNHSTDGTTELLAGLAEANPQLVHIVPDETTLGIGGCWNRAIMDARCGRFAIQLDSDDVYSRPDVIETIVRKFRQEGAAMVIGSYELTDFNLATIPPGVIDHREWTDTNGPNNALRINGLGAPRAFFTGLVRRMPFPNVSYGEDYAMALQMSRSYPIARIYDVLYLCRRWGGNSDAVLDEEKANRFNHYKDTLRTWEIKARQMNND